jgi:tRNA 2-thiouridine synthesizing protein D
MDFIVLVQTAPGGGQAPHSALAFARAACAAGHRVRQVFFLGEGVRGVTPDAPPADQAGLNDTWRALAQREGTELLVCVSAAERRGLHVGVGAGAISAGTLGQLMTALDGARVVRFCG